MHLFSTTFLANHRFKLLFVVIWLHVSVLDLFYITYNGPVFLWQDNAQLLTLVVHFSIALATTGLYKIMSKARVNKSQELSKQ
ncbi:hypothetical protein [Candidatus Colwellia aromaticivorans]|uniref:hypothetical protein n=1 Tax=Candidatus Colwellia aromaticivorans TaxID=2267621 RepID=UPI00109B7B52|nr:hypothetical protein [Candidatus Colwellia aromaticivorans]